MKNLHPIVEESKDYAILAKDRRKVEQARRKFAEQYDRAEAEYAARLKQHREAVEAAYLAGEPEPPEPEFAAPRHTTVFTERSLELQAREREILRDTAPELCAALEAREREILDAAAAHYAALVEAASELDLIVGSTRAICSANPNAGDKRSLYPDVVTAEAIVRLLAAGDTTFLAPPLNGGRTIRFERGALLSREVV